jgi:hypothetical protein
MPFSHNVSCPWWTGVVHRQLKQNIVSRFVYGVFVFHPDEMVIVKHKCQNTCHFTVIELTSPDICVSSLHHIKAEI